MLFIHCHCQPTHPPPWKNTFIPDTMIDNKLHSWLGIKYQKSILSSSLSNIHQSIMNSNSTNFHTLLIGTSAHQRSSQKLIKLGPSPRHCDELLIHAPTQSAVNNSGSERWGSSCSRTPTENPSTKDQVKMHMVFKFTKHTQSFIRGLLT